MYCSYLQLQVIDLVYLSGQLLESLTQPGFGCIILQCQPTEDSYKRITIPMQTLTRLPWSN